MQILYFLPHHLHIKLIITYWVNRSFGQFLKELGVKSIIEAIMFSCGLLLTWPNLLFKGLLGYQVSFPDILLIILWDTSSLCCYCIFYSSKQGSQSYCSTFSGPKFRCICLYFPETTPLESQIFHLWQHTPLKLKV